MIVIAKTTEGIKVMGESMAESAVYDLETLNDCSPESMKIVGPGKDAVEFFRHLHGYHGCRWKFDSDSGGGVTPKMSVIFRDGSAVVWVPQYKAFGYTKCPE